MLRQIRLQNFRSWKNLNIDLAPLTVLFGPNNSGKSNILSALLLLKQTTRVDDPINFGGDMNRDYIDFGNYTDVVFNHNENLSLSIGLSWDNPKNTSGGVVTVTSPVREPVQPRYDVTWKREGDRVVLQRIAYSYEDSSYPNLRVDRLPDGDYRYTGSFLDEQEQPWPPPVSCFLIPVTGRTFHSAPDIFNSVFANLMNDMSYLGPVRSEPEREYPWRNIAPYQIDKRGEGTIQTLIASERIGDNGENLVQNVRNWLVAMGVVADFRMESFDIENRYYRIGVRTRPGGSEGTLADVGFGVSQVLPVITLLFSAEPGSILLLEQPELHLHPHAQSVLADLMLEVAEKRNLQLIVESHSEHLLRRFQRRIAESYTAFATPENIQAYFCEMGDDGSQIQAVDVDAYGQVRNWPEGFFGDISADLDAMFRAGVEKRKREVADG